MVAERVHGVVRRFWTVVIETYEQWRNHRTIRLGAGLAYYGLFALVPMLAVVLALAGIVISLADVQSYLAEQLSTLVGVTGSVFLVLLWTYYEAQIVLVGAEFTRVLARRRLSTDDSTSSAAGDREAGATPRRDATSDVGG